MSMCVLELIVISNLHGLLGLDFLSESGYFMFFYKIKDSDAALFNPAIAGAA